MSRKSHKSRRNDNVIVIEQNRSHQTVSYLNMTQELKCDKGQRLTESAYIVLRHMVSLQCIHKSMRVINTEIMTRKAHKVLPLAEIYF